MLDKLFISFIVTFGLICVFATVFGGLYYAINYVIEQGPWLVFAVFVAAIAIQLWRMVYEFLYE